MIQHASSADSLPPRPPGFVISKRRDLRSFNPNELRELVIFPSTAAHTAEQVDAVVRGHEKSKKKIQTGLGVTVCSAGSDGEPGWGQTQQHVRASPLSSLLNRKLPVPVKESGTPSSDAVSSGHLPPREASIRRVSGFFLSPMSGCSTLRAQTTRGKPYGAPSALRRGKAGAPLLKGQKPDVALKSCGPKQMGQMTSTSQEPSIGRTHVASSQRWCLYNWSVHFTSHFLWLLTSLSLP